MTDSSKRLFFALWPSPAARKALEGLAQSAARRADAKPTRADTLHLTLVFLGNCTADQAVALRDGAATCASPCFELVFDRLGCWKNNGIVWLAPSASPPALLALERQLRELAAGLKLPLDRRPYSPHLTLARKARKALVAEDSPPLAWQVERFCLIESELHSSGSRYREVASWRLSE